VTNVPECQTTLMHASFHAIKITWLITAEYIYARLWEYVLIVTV